MIAYLKGKVTEISELNIIIEVMGMGYEVCMASNQITNVLLDHQETKIYIYEHIKEDAHDLYGFLTKEEKQLFKKLISVSGIGPKGGMQILNMYTPDEVITFILEQNSKALSKAPGIGPKTAQRMILELKDSISRLSFTNLEQSFTTPMHTDYKDEAIEALIALGYANQDASKAVKAVFDYQDTTEQIIKKALSVLAL
ncbi:MAG: Holliday junction branch migration protein RuvA [Cellulosilyticaceae bacterium]